MSSRQIEKLFITSCDRILIALLERGKCTNSVLAEAAGLHPVHLSRLLAWLENNGLVFSKRVYGRRMRGGVKKINRLTSKGRKMAEYALKSIEVLREELSEREIRELNL